ncbi:CLUMA_CG005143, isoform A [Clunio marinus]|uniref:CLUMA_CG005143, isoform A n=1 Tax=Clunio marinus TaxID=568069 RepID=A0A1J1HU01_9DIPT|nr:CLUMA_CG005143, isoform A [Clunio marinus]
MIQHRKILLLLLLTALFAIKNSLGNVNLPPVFTQDMNNLALSETTPLHSIVYTLEGYDPEGGNVTFGLIGTENFEVNPITGDVQLTKQLDRETQDTLSFLVSIKDKVNESGDSENDNFVQVPITIIILDENDNPPEFQNVPYETIVLEDAAIGTTVFDKILITDRDAVGENLDVTCIGESQHDDACNKFEIKVLESHQDRLKAAIVLKEKLDYNENMIFNIPLLTTDGLFNTTTSMEVRVVDVQNTPPIFQGSLSTIISEDSPIGTLVLTLQARDGDKGAPRKIVYDIMSNPMDYFLVDSKSGELRTAKPLDKEELPEASGIITLIIRAREVVDGVPSNDVSASTTTKVSITIRDVNDVPPTFNQKEYFVTIPENTAVGTPLPLNIVVDDPDVGQNSVFLLRLDDSIVSEVFDIEPKLVTGTSQVSIRVANGSLDYENVNQRKFIVLIYAEETLTNPKLSSTATLTVSITDVNDNFPQFDQESYTATVSEIASPGQFVTAITATDVDSGVFGDQGIRYMLNGTDAELFKVDPLTGTITVAECPRHVSSKRKRRQTNDLEYHNHIKRVNVTNPGEFGILNINVDHHTTEASDYITYQVETQDESESTKNDSPRIGKYPCLDYETQTDYYLNYRAIDNEGKGQMSVTSLRISVIDANDSPPKCESSIYRATLDEGATSFDGSGLTIKARDDDVLSEITYQIIGNDIVSQSFEVDKRTGQLFIKKGTSLDVNHLNGESIVFSVEASDGLFSTLCDVNITLRDVNNHAPMFSQSHYITSLEENLPIGTQVGELNATDLDTGENAEIVYRIQHGSFNDFHVDNRTGVITIAKPLDYDVRPNYTLEIIASDKGIPSLSGTATMTINVINSNDKAPYFTPTTQRAEISEDAEVGTFVHKLTANDPDITSVDLLEFSWNENLTTAVNEDGEEVPTSNVFGEYFAIDKTGSVTVNKKLRRDLFAVIRLTVFVTDTTAPVLQQGRGLLIITIIDINEQPPIFQSPWSINSPKYEFEFMEEQPLKTILTTLHATDADSTISEYKLINGSDGDNGSEYFEINNVTGVIRTKSRIDYETVKMIKFNVTVTDTGIPQLTSSAQIYVKIININDNAPQFNETEYNLNVNENAIKRTSIGSVYAHDADEGDFGTIKYSLLGEQSQYFEIDEKSGEIFVADSTELDREKHSEIVLSAVATDQGLPIEGRRSTTTNVVVKIWDVNDNLPEFRQKSYYASIAENLSLNPPATILQVQADDKDQDEAGTVKYSILSGNVDNSFKLDANSGILYPATSLIGRKGQYILKVEARDGIGFGPHTATTEIVIDVIEVNQHRPVFIMPALSNATVEIQEHLAVKDYLVLTVKANDSDSGENGKISYHLQVNNENVPETETFEINEMNGELRLKQKLDRKKKSRYEIILVARDHGVPTNFEQLRFLTILLVDNNEGNPEFPDASNPYKFSVTENGERDVRIGKIQALVHESGRERENHHAIFYYILLGNEEGAFYIDKTSGDVFTNKSLDRETVDMYALYILASKKSDLHISESELMFLSMESLERNSTIAKVWISVLDENDNAPEFSQDSYYAGVSKKSGMNELIALINATDKDFGVNATIELLITASYLYKYGATRSTGSLANSPFAISQDGRLTTNAFMAEYNQDRFELEIQAKETQSPERTTTAKVYIWIYEPEQLVRVILSRSPSEVQNERDEIMIELTNVTKKHIIIDDIRYHVDGVGRIRMDWTDLFFHAVDPKTKNIVPVFDILNEIDSKYDFLKDYYSGFAIENVIPAYSVSFQEEFDIALAAIIALLIVLFVGAISFIVLCCCLKNWVISIPTETRRKDALIKKQIIEDLNTTENPLWIEQKLKIYEEQELTMKIFAEPSEFQLPPDNSSLRQQNSITQNLLGMETPPAPLLIDSFGGFGSSDAGGDLDNNYATIQPINYSNNNSSSTANNSRSTNNTVNLIDADYQTLRSSPRAPPIFEFSGSTFQVQQSDQSSDYIGELM